MRHGTSPSRPRAAFRMLGIGALLLWMPACSLDRSEGPHLVAPTALTSAEPGQLHIVSVAGRGNGDGLHASRARMSGQQGMRFDAEGNLFISDQNAFRVRRVDRHTGIITTVAGNGTFGFSGDGGPATQAQLSNCPDVAFGADGSLYITDVLNQRVRRVSVSPAPPVGDGNIDGDADEVITTFSGNGELEWTGDDGPATQAGHVFPFLLGVDPTHRYLFVSDDTAVRRIDLESGIITTVLGAAAGEDCPEVAGHAADTAVLWPLGLAVDGAGNLLVSHLGDHSVLKVLAGPNGVVDGIMFDPEVGQLCPADDAELVERVVGTGVLGTDPDGAGPLGPAATGPAGQIPLSGPHGLELDPQGNLLIAESGVAVLEPFSRNPTWGRRIRRVEAGDGEIDASDTMTTIALNGVFDTAGDGGPALSASMFQPVTPRLDADGNLFLSDHGLSRVRRIDAETGVVSTLIGAGANGPAMGVALAGPDGIGMDSEGNLLIADSGFNRVRRVEAGADGRLGVDGPATIVAGNSARMYNEDGIAATAAAVFFPHGPVLERDGQLYIADFNNHRVRRVAADGTISTIAGIGLAGAQGDGGPALLARLNLPSALAFDSGGNLYIADQGNHRIRRVNTAGIIATVAGTGVNNFSGDGGPATQATMRGPHGGLVVDPAGTIYFSDTNNHRVRRIDTAGIISTVAGTGVTGYNGDDIPATQASLFNPQGLAFERDGEGGVPALLIADGRNNRIRRLDFATGLISTVAGTGDPGFTGDGGAAAAAQLNAPAQIVFDEAGVLYLADSGNHRIRRLVWGAIIEISPARLNPRSNGRWVTASIALVDRDGVEIEVESVALQALDAAGDPVLGQSVEVAEGAPRSLEDSDGDGLQELVVKFDRAVVASWLVADSVAMRLSGRLTNGAEFVGDTRIERAGP